MLYNTKLLSVVFIGLLALYTITKVVNSNKGERSFISQIAAVDTAQVQAIVLYPQIEKQKQLTLIRSQQQWIAQQDKLQVLAEKGKISGLLNDLRRVRPKRLVANDQSKWAEYQLTDSLCTRLKLLGSNGQELMTLLIGKTGAGESFVRLPNENEVYAVEGYLSVNVNKGFNDWRNQDVLTFNSNLVEKIAFTYPGDSSITLKRETSAWKMGEEVADSTLVAQYLTSISAKRSKDFANNFTPQQQPNFILQLSGKGLTVAGKPVPEIVVQGFDTNNEVYIRTSVNPSAIFSGKKSGLHQAIFKSKSDFIKKAEPDKKANEKEAK